MCSKEQSRLLAQSKAQCTSLSSDGDGQAYTYGHSVQYGSYQSYGIIDFNTNKLTNSEGV